MKTLNKKIESNNLCHDILIFFRKNKTSDAECIATIFTILDFFTSTMIKIHPNSELLLKTIKFLDEIRVFNNKQNEYQTRGKVK